MQWKMLQQNKADDYVIASGKQMSVKVVNNANILVSVLNGRIKA